jgi:phenylacetate-CoA ligase/benzoylacetate-CoA ligase
MTTREYWNQALETLPWKEVERWQLRELTAVLPRLRARSKLYSRLPALQLRELADLRRLPFTLKDQLRAAQEAASAAEPFGGNQAAALEDIVQCLSSSGTTGRPLYYALTVADVERFADAIATAWYTAGLRRGDVIAHLVGLPMVAGGLPYADGFRRIGATLCWLGGFPTERILREMRMLRASAILATTSFALHLASQWSAAGDEAGVPSELRSALCGGEPGLSQPEIRARIRQGLGLARLRETMGLGDVIPCMWAECEAEDGMHFTAQRYVIIELIDPLSDESRPWSSGATGEVVYTAFARDATPVVRYRSRDHVVVVGSDCACGRSSPRIRCVGRTDDMLIYKGMNVFPTALRDLIAARFRDRVEPFIHIWKDHAGQVRFDQPIGIDVEVRPDFDMSRAEVLGHEIENEVRSQLQVRVAVNLVGAGTLPRNTYKNSLTGVRGMGGGN